VRDCRKAPLLSGVYSKMPTLSVTTTVHLEMSRALARANARPRLNVEHAIDRGRADIDHGQVGGMRGRRRR
jgi:hypothetical protein